MAAAVPLFLLKSEGAVFALHNGQLLQGGPELQHLLTQAMTVKGEPPLKPRLSGAIVRPSPPLPSPPLPLSAPSPHQAASLYKPALICASQDGTRYDLGDFRIFVGQARVSERGRGEVLAVDYRPCTQWENGPNPKRQKVDAGGDDSKAKEQAAAAAKKEGAVKTETPGKKTTGERLLLM